MWYWWCYKVGVLLTEAEVLKAQEAVVHAVVAKLGANVAYGDPRQGLMGLQVPDWGDEGMHAVVLALGEQASHQDDMGGGLPQTCRLLKVISMAPA